MFTFGFLESGRLNGDEGESLGECEAAGMSASLERQRFVKHGRYNNGGSIICPIPLRPGIFLGGRQTADERKKSVSLSEKDERCEE